MAPTNNQRLAGIPNFNHFFAFPTMLRCTLPYVETLGIGSNTTNNQLGNATDFVPNALYAPLGSGHQPYSFDQLCGANGPYTKYKVLGYKCKLTFINLNLVTPLFVCVRVRNITDNYSLTNALVEAALERQGTKMLICPLGPGHCSTTISVPDLSVLFNWSKEQYSADQTDSSGSYGSAPSRLVTLQIAVSNPLNTTQYFVNCTAEFMFDCVFYERQSLPTS